MLFLGGAKSLEDMKYLLNPEDYNNMLNPSEFQWEHMKVLMLNFSGLSYKSWEEFQADISYEMIEQSMKLGTAKCMDYYEKLNYKQFQLGRILKLQIDFMKKQNISSNNVSPKVVLLIDEYDHPYRSFAFFF